MLYYCLGKSQYNSNTSLFRCLGKVLYVEQLRVQHLLSGEEITMRQTRKKKILIEIFYHFHGINSMKITQILFLLLIYRVPWSRSQIIRKLVSTKIILVVCSCSLYLCIQFSNICNRYILFFCTTVYSQLYLFHFGRNFFENSVLEDRQWFSISRLNSNFHSI